MYNSTEGLDIKNKGNKGIQSPSLGLFHEVIHRFIEVTYSDERKKELEQSSGREADVIKEEFEVVDKYETEAVKILISKGKTEAYRHSYGWDSKAVTTNGATSTTKTKKKEVSGGVKNRDVTTK